MRNIFIALLTISVLIFAFVGCSSDEPEYMHPYGEGVDPSSVTTVPFQSRTTVLTTTTETTGSTTTTQTLTPQTAPQDIPEGHILCPLCQGIRVVCEQCLGTKRLKAEIYNESTGTFVRKYVDCDCTSPEGDPGFEMCEVCKNQLFIEE